MSNVLKYTLTEDVPVIIKPKEFRNAAIAAELNKQESPTETSLEDIREELEKNLSQAKIALEKSRIEAEEIINQAHQQAEAIKQQAYSEGHESGYKEGLEKGENDINDQMRKLISDAAQKAQHLLELTEWQTKEMIINANDQIVDIAIAAIKRALCQEILAAPEVVVAVVKEALEKVREHEQITIRVNPQDFDLVVASKHDLQKILGREHDLSLAADSTIGCGGCCIDTSDGAVDARLDTKLELLTKTLLEVKKIEDGATL